MSFKFRPWKPAEDFGDPAQVVRAFKAAARAVGARTPILPDRNIVFEVVDIRPSTTPEAVETLLATLTRLFLQDQAADALRHNSRLLFAGRAMSLGEWESEAAQRSVNRDAELFVRALQSLEIAHYVCVEPQRRGTSSAEWMESALFAFHRHYSDCANAQLDAVAELNQLKGDIANLFESAQSRVGFERLGIPGDYRAGGARRSDDILLDEIRLLYQLGTRDRRSPYSPDRELREHDLTVELDLPSTSYELLSEIENRVGPWAFEYRVSKRIPKGRQATSSAAGATPRLSAAPFGLKREAISQLAGLVGADSTLRLRRRLSGLRLDRHPMGATGDWQAAQWLAGATFKMKRYEMLRDLARLIGSNSVAQLRNRLRELRVRGGPLFLVVDDFIYFHLTDERQRKAVSDHVVQGMKRVFKVADCEPRDFVVVPTRSLPCDGANFGGDSDRSIFQWPKLAVDLAGKPARRHAKLEDYAAILIDPEATSDALGPVRIQRLANHLRRTVGTDGDAARNVPIIAFSQRESSGIIQQCLNLGAASFTAKHRPYHLLFDLNRVLRPPGRKRPSTEKASQFRILRTLKPRATAKLRRTNGPAYIHGGFHCENRSGPPGLDHFLDDGREEAWLKELPKADLHCHIGTCIDYPTIELMALNTVGYMLGSKQPCDNETPANDPGSAADGAKPLLQRAAEAVVLATELAAKSKAPALVRLAAAATGLIEREPELAFKPFGLGDAVIEHIRSVDERCDTFQVAAVLVAMISLHPRFDRARAPYEKELGALDYLRKLHRKIAAGPEQARAEGDPEFSTERALEHALDRAMNRLREISHRWDGRFTESQIRAAFPLAFAEAASAAKRSSPPGSSNRLASDLHRLIRQLRLRSLAAEQVLAGFLREAGADKRPDGVRERLDAARERAMRWLEKHAGVDTASEPPSKHSHPLEPYVLAPSVPTRDGRRSGLQLYLQGADLLGSAHLQYPDNLLLATYAINRDNAMDNILYSEVRCETTGYTRAGMSALDATEMLRHGFNVSSLFLATQPVRGGGSEPSESLPLVRTNVLLAAKRHKNEEEARKVVALLESYLERRPGEVEQALGRMRYAQPFPAWWRPSEVVGFDISGDESKDRDWLAEVIRPLAACSSPITIHAGEAADAQSIWRAVYALNATRIGHGLRLNEDQALLSYCVREGICMEMCPNSNAATNGFRAIPALADSPFPLLQYEYPLLHYMRAGMEVSLGSDNRYLHREGRRDLTSEYVAAARLVGGLTRWEVLQIVKAGFKNAFLAKVEISEMLSAVEEKIYSIAAADAS